MRRIYFIGALVLGGVLLAAGVAWAVFSWIVKDTTQVETARNLTPVVVAQDGIKGLYPGASQPYSVSVHNPNVYPIQITYLQGYNPRSAGSACQDHAVVIDPDDKKGWKGLVIPPNTTVAVKTRVIMKTWVKEPCSGQVLPFEVTVQASQVATR